MYSTTSKKYLDPLRPTQSQQKVIGSSYYFETKYISFVKKLLTNTTACVQ